MNSTSYKLVDHFNGWESSKIYSTMEQAERALEKQRRRFYAHPGHAHAYFMAGVVPADLTWGWNERMNRFEWA